MVAIRPVTTSDVEPWLSLRCALWPDGSESEHRAEIEQFLSDEPREPQGVLLAVAESEKVVGLAELTVGPYGEGCRTGRVANLEGWYVVPGHRRQGIGRALVEAAQEWGRERDCAELASDARPNDESRRAYRALGFEEVGIVRCFRKNL